MTSKRRLEAAQTAAEADAAILKRAARTEAQLLRAENKLHELGHERKTQPDTFDFGSYLHGYDVFDYEQTKAAEQKVREDRAGWFEEIATARTTGRATGRTEALRTVIKALELSAYDKTAADTGTDRFWADLQTALEVRAERAATAARQATETKITRLTKDAHAPGDRIAFYLADPGPGAPSFGAAQTMDAPKPTPAPKAKKGGKK